MSKKVSWKDSNGIWVVDYDTLDNINLFVNRNTKYVADVLGWNKLDYWQTPEETERLGRGDCEDYALLKAKKLLLAGANQEAMRLLIVEPRHDPKSRHAVLAVNTIVDSGILWWKKPVTVTLLADNMWNTLYTLRESGHKFIKTAKMPDFVTKS